MSSLRSSKKKQTRLAFSPFPSSSPQAAAHSPHIRERAAAVKYEDFESPTKKRKLQSGRLDAFFENSSVAAAASGQESHSAPSKSTREDNKDFLGNGKLGLPTPAPSSQVLGTGDISRFLFQYRLIITEKGRKRVGRIFVVLEF